MRMQQLHDTAANWTSADSVLRAGEIGVEEDTGQFKIGDGSTAWTSLPYAGGGGAMALDDLTDVNAPSPTDQYVLTWDDMAGEWVPATPAGGAPTGAAGGDLSGTYPNPSVVNSSHDHDATTAPGDPHTALRAVDFLVGTASAETSAEIVVGTSPGGELGGTWASPTVDATHSGSAHHDAVTVGTGLDVTGQLVELDLSEVAAGGELGGFMDAPTVDATHSGSAHHTEDHDHDGSPTQKLLQANTHETPDTDSAPTALHHTLGTGANQAAAGNDSRLSDSRAPSGSAGGDLSGTYPNPSVTDDSHAHSASTLTGVATLGATEPGAVSTTASGTAGSGSTASKVDHSHDLGFDDATADPSEIGAVADGTATSAARKDHVHATGAGTPSTQAFGDVAATGTGPAAAMTDHVHGMPDNPAGANSGGGDIDIASVTDITIASITTTIVAGNVFLFEIWGTIFNNSTASRIYTFTLDVNGFLVSIATSAGLTNSATARSPFSYSGHVEVRATNLVYGDAILGYRNSIAAATATAETARLWVWNTGTSDRTGVGKVVAIKVKSANATATQNLLYFARITKV